MLRQRQHESSWAAGANSFDVHHIHHNLLQFLGDYVARSNAICCDTAVSNAKFSA